LLAASFFHYNPGDMGQMINFMKNITIAGGFLVLVGAGPGALPSTICGADGLGLAFGALAQIDDCVLRKRIGDGDLRHQGMAPIIAA